MQELENENDKLKREVAKLMESIAKTVNFSKGAKPTAAGKEFLGMKVKGQVLTCANININIEMLKLNCEH